jgi:hypothetical protein
MLDNASLYFVILKVARIRRWRTLEIWKNLSKKFRTVIVSHLESDQFLVRFLSITSGRNAFGRCDVEGRRLVCAKN